ncbi:MAG TPA: plasmid replication DNA-binding protein [Alphaproteobacteria bacterium]|nr:plasmid replication DNA-binding protein [Alphaproteobacteria bacterium]
MSKSKVSVVEASKMAGVSRATFYRHITEKKISTTQDDKGNTVIDVSELVRIYGNKLKSLEEIEKEETDQLDESETERDSSLGLKIQVDMLKERLKDYNEERDRERNQLTEQIEALKSQLARAEEQRIKSEDQKNKLTLMLTDQRSDSDRLAAKDAVHNQKLTELEITVKTLIEKQTRMIEESSKKKGLWRKLFG